MFSGIKRRWAEARADVAAKEVEDFIRRFHDSGRASQGWAFRAFDAVYSANGDVSNLSDDHKRALAKQYMQWARSAFHGSQNSMSGQLDAMSAPGAALLSLYYEALTLPGPAARHIVDVIDDWYAQASQAE